MIGFRVLKQTIPVILQLVQPKLAIDKLCKPCSSIIKPIFEIWSGGKIEIKNKNEVIISFY